MSPGSRRTGRIFRSEQYLSPRYVPETPVGREGEIDELASTLQTMARRNIPENVWVYGPAGVGKTSCVTHALDRVEEDTGAKQVYINCWQYNSRSALITELLIQLGYPAVRRGKSVDELVSKLEIWLDRNRDIAVALDEVDQLQDRTEVIYDLQHVDEQADNDIGLVLVSNQHPSDISLDSRARSRLSCRTLEFQPYSAEQLQEILEERVQEAFRPDSVSESVVATVAEHVAGRSGDCRQALELLLQAGRNAEEDRCDVVDEAHLPIRMKSAKEA